MCCEEQARAKRESESQTYACPCVFAVSCTSNRSTEKCLQTCNAMQRHRKWHIHLYSTNPLASLFFHLAHRERLKIAFTHIVLLHRHSDTCSCTQQTGALYSCTVDVPMSNGSLKCCLIFHLKVNVSPRARLSPVIMFKTGIKMWISTEKKKICLHISIQSPP